MLNGEVGYGDGYGDTPLPFFKNFYVGGVNSLRGFKVFTVGPKDVQRQPARRQHASSSATPSSCSRSRACRTTGRVRMSAFVDTGMVGRQVTNSRTWRVLGGHRRALGFADGAA